MDSVPTIAELTELHKTLKASPEACVRLVSNEAAMQRLLCGLPGESTKLTVLMLLVWGELTACPKGSSSLLLVDKLIAAVLSCMTTIEVVGYGVQVLRNVVDSSTSTAQHPSLLRALLIQVSFPSDHQLQALSILETLASTRVDNRMDMLSTTVPLLAQQLLLPQQSDEVLAGKLRILGLLANSSDLETLAQVVPALLIKIACGSDQVKTSALLVLSRLVRALALASELVTRFPQLTGVLASALGNEGNSQLVQRMALDLMCKLAPVPHPRLLSALAVRIQNEAFTKQVMLLAYRLCRASPTNADLITANSELLMGLMQVKQAGNTNPYLTLTLIHLFPNNTVSQESIEVLLALVSPNSDSTIITPAEVVLAFRLLCALQSHRVVLWNYYGSKFLVVLLSTLRTAIQKSEPETAEHSMATLLHFCSDPKPLRWMRAHKPNLDQVLCLLTELEFPTAFKSATLFPLLLLIDAPKPQSKHALEPGPLSADELNVSVQGMIPPFLFACLAPPNWDFFLTKLDQYQVEVLVPHLLSILIELDAPLKVIQHVVASNRDEVNAAMPLFQLRAPLSLALVRDREDVANYLLDQGADVKAKDGGGATPLLLGMLSSPQLTSRLIALGSNVNVITPDGLTALDILASIPNDGGGAVINLLLESGANPNLSTVSDRSPLLIALDKGNLLLATALLTHGANVNLRVNDGRCAMHLLASAFWNAEEIQSELVLEVFELMVAQGAGNQVNVRAPTLEGPSPAFVFTSHPTKQVPQVAARLVELGADADLLLLAAVQTGRIFDLELALQLGANPNYSSRQMGALMRVAQVPNLAPNLGLEVAKLLLVAGADIHAPFEGKDGSVLWSYVLAGRVDLVRLALQCGASKSIRLRNVRAFDMAKARGFANLLPLLAEEEDGVMEDCGRAHGLDLELRFAFTYCARCRETNVELKACSGCMMVAYCSEQCQAAHWKPHHHSICKQRRRALSVLSLCSVE